MFLVVFFLLLSILSKKLVWVHAVDSVQEFWVLFDYFRTGHYVLRFADDVWNCIFWNGIDFNCWHRITGVKNGKVKSLWDMSDFEERLKGGHPNSLGNTVAIVDEVLQNKHLFDEFFSCYFSDNEVVRLRVSNGMKRICKANQGILVPYLDRFLSEVALIQQASVQWTLAQLFLQLEKWMTKPQKQTAQNILKNNLIKAQDWIVLCQTMQTLGIWAKNEYSLERWLYPQLKRLSGDKRKSVAGKALRILATLEN